METFSELLAISAGNSPITGEFTAQMASNAELWYFFDLHLNEWLRKQSRGWCFQMPSRPLWRHSNDYENLFKSARVACSNFDDVMTRKYFLHYCTTAKQLINPALTHWGRVTHLCVTNPGHHWRHAIIWTNAGLLLTGSLETNFSEILIEIYTF